MSDVIVHEGEIVSCWKCGMELLVAVKSIHSFDVIKANLFSQITSYEFGQWLADGVRCECPRCHSQWLGGPTATNQIYVKGRGWVS